MPVPFPTDFSLYLFNKYSDFYSLAVHTDLSSHILFPVKLHCLFHEWWAMFTINVFNSLKLEDTFTPPWHMSFFPLWGFSYFILSPHQIWPNSYFNKTICPITGDWYVFNSGGNEWFLIYVTLIIICYKSLRYMSNINSSTHSLLTFSIFSLCIRLECPSGLHVMRGNAWFGRDGATVARWGGVHISQASAHLYSHPQLPTTLSSLSTTKPVVFSWIFLAGDTELGTSSWENNWTI